jgi:hypothetical protein
MCRDQKVRKAVDQNGPGRVWRGAFKGERVCGRYKVCLCVCWVGSDGVYS